MLTPFETALIAHFCADWILQNDWMAYHKHRLRHPAAWVHGLIHGLLLTIALGWQGGVVLGLLHVLIDTRLPLIWWAKRYGKTVTGTQGTHVAIWTDQVLHIVTIALWIVWQKTIL